MTKQERAELLNEMRRFYFEKDWTISQIATHYGVSKQAIFGKFKRSGVKLQRKKRKAVKFLDGEILSEIYEKEKLSALQVSARLKVSYYLVLKELERHGIEKRSHGWTSHKYPRINKLEVGEILTVARPAGKQPHRYFYYYAQVAGIKVSVKSLDRETLLITRIE